MHYILSITVSKDKPLIQLSKKILAPFVIEFEVVTTVSNLIY